MTTERKKFLLDMFNTALEGGICYWSVADAYHWLNDDDTEDLGGFYAVILDTEDDDKPYRIDADVIELGIERIVNGVVRLPSDLLRTVALINATNGDEGGYNAETADCIVQAGLFGEVMYG